MESSNANRMKIKRYKPGVSPYAQRRSEQDWEGRREMLTRMHEQHYTRRQMLEALKALDFDVTSGQLLAQMKKWELAVYITRAESSVEHNMPELLEAVWRSQSIDPTAEKHPDRDVTLPVRPGSASESFDSHDAGMLGDICLVSSNLSDGADSIDWLESSSTLNEILLNDMPVPPEALDVEYLDTKNDNTSDEQGMSPSLQEMISEHRQDVFGTKLQHAQYIQRQLATITEPWCYTFPTDCCCHAFFHHQDNFTTSPELYRIMLEQSSSCSLKYAIILVNLMTFPNIDVNRQELREPLWSTIEYYLMICTRPTYKNSLASHILHSLVQAWNTWFGDDLSIPTTGFSKLRIGSLNTLVSKIMKARPVNADNTDTSIQSDWQSEAERNVNTIIGFLARRPSTFPLTDWSGEAFGSLNSPQTLRVQQDANELLKFAQALSKYMREACSREASGTSEGSKSTPLELLGDCDLFVIFDSLGLMIALELNSYATDLLDNTEGVSESSHWPPELRNFIDTIVRTLSLNAEYAEKFRKSYWLVTGKTIGYQGKNIHFGSCNAMAEWRTLDRSIYEYDAPRTWIERRLFSGRNEWPKTEDLMTSDNMSMRSVSSFNSFRRFQALAFHLKIVTPHSRSIRTKSTRSGTSKMSLDSHLSWQLEHMLGI